MSERVDRGLQSIAWLVVAVCGAVMITQALGLDPGRVVAALQSLTPHLILVLVVVAGVAVVRGWFPIATVSAIAGLGGVVLAAPLVFPPAQPTPAENAQPIRVAAVNLLHENPDVGRVGDLVTRLDVDLVVFTEYTAEHQQALLGHPVAERFPHRVDRDGLLAGGTAVWSRFPVDPVETPAMTNYDVDVSVSSPAGSFRLWAVHPPSPCNPAWERELRHIADRAASIDEPLVVAGDFNASYWHPVFRDLLDAGLVAAHLANHRGWSASWPTDRWFPPFVRIDHALTNDGLVSTDVSDVDVPGSDHRGFVVTLTRAA